MTWTSQEPGLSSGSATNNLFPSLSCDRTGSLQLLPPLFQEFNTGISLAGTQSCDCCHFVTALKTAASSLNGSKSFFLALLRLLSGSDPVFFPTYHCLLHSPPPPSPPVRVAGSLSGSDLLTRIPGAFRQHHFPDQ